MNIEAGLKWLKQKTTIAGIISALTTIFGVSLAPELAAEITTVVAAAASIALMYLNGDDKQ